MNKIKLVVVLLFIIFHTNCINKSNYKDNNKHDIIDYSYQKKFLIDSFISEIKYIPLEITEESLINEASQLYFSNQYIYIFDKVSNSVKVFSKQGNFIKKLGNIGQGPGEYVRISSICLDNENIYINDFENKILVFSKDNLMFIKEYSNIKCSKMIRIHDDGWAFMNFLDDYSVDIYDTTFKYITSYIPNEVKSGYLEWPTYRFYQFNDSNYVFPPHTNKIYYFDIDTCYCYREIIFGNNSIIPNDIYQEKSDNNQIKDIRNDSKYVQDYKHIDGKDFFITSYRIGKELFLGVNRKIDNETYFVKSNENEFDKYEFVFMPDSEYESFFITKSDINVLNMQKYCKNDTSFINMRDTIPFDSDILVLWKINQKY